MSKVEYTPLKGYVVIEPFAREQESESGLVLEAKPKANSNTEGVLRVVNKDDLGSGLEVGLVYSFVTGVSLYEKQVSHNGSQCYILPIANIISQVH